MVWARRRRRGHAGIAAGAWHCLRRRCLGSCQCDESVREEAKVEARLPGLERTFKEVGGGVGWREAEFWGAAHHPRRAPHLCATVQVRLGRAAAQAAAPARWPTRRQDAGGKD